MFARFLGALVAALVVLSLIGVRMLMRPAVDLAAADSRATSTLARTLVDAAHHQDMAAPVDWVITKATSAHRAMVVDVEARALSEADGIARQIVEPVRTHGYDEILIYVRQPGMREHAVRRVQWTPNGGYVGTTYSDR